VKEALFYKRLKDNVVQCGLCPHACVIAPDKRGKCGVRENQDGILCALTYGKPVTTAVDPIEKKPFYHFLPGTRSYSIACAGCNLSCKFCQNWEISQMPKTGHITGESMTPEQIVEEAISYKCKSISYTYTEPTIFFEFCFDIATAAKKSGLKNTFVTNGFISKQAIDKVASVLDAANIDLKGFTEDFYKDYCDARLQPVLDAIRQYHEKGVFLEITTLIIPGLNDDESSVRGIAKFIASVDKSIPWHVSRFFPHYEMVNKSPTPVRSVQQAVAIGKEAGLHYVYAGNLPGHDTDNTFCSACGKRIITRHGFNVTESHLDKNKCKFCRAEQNFIT
jgi:pyruvate formate lyase activating enzyme